MHIYLYVGLYKYKYRIRPIEHTVLNKRNP